jgi:hypothetical protein
MVGRTTESERLLPGVGLALKLVIPESDSIFISGLSDLSTAKAALPCSSDLFWQPAITRVTTMGKSKVASLLSLGDSKARSDTVREHPRGKRDGRSGT